MAISEHMRLRQQQILAGRPIPEKKRKGLNKVSPKTAAKLAEQKKANSIEGKEESLNDWFQRIEDKHWGKFDEQDGEYDHPDLIVTCQECGSIITRPYARHATAHLLEKRHFKSVATNDNNYVILCAKNGCHDKSHRVDKIVTLKAWPEIKEKINSLLPLLPTNELQYISAQLYHALDNV